MDQEVYNGLRSSLDDSEPSEESLEDVPVQDEPSYIEFAPSFLAMEDPPVHYLVNELIPSGVLILPHGEPRTMKTWAALELAVSVATDRLGFNLERFATQSAYPVLYSSQEDDARRVRDRVKRLLRGRGIERYPETLAFAVHKGIDLENAKWQSRLCEDIQRYGFKLVVFDPIRRYSSSVDKGPAEVRMITSFLRRLCVETGTSIVIVHHDVKPNAQMPDNRRRGHRASGGDWFAAAECPMMFEPAGNGRTLVIPEDYKFSSDPRPFVFRLEEDTAKASIRLVGEDVAATEANTLALDEKVVQYLTEHKGSSGRSIVRGCRARREDVAESLVRLFETNRIDSVNVGRKKEWFLRA